MKDVDIPHFLFMWAIILNHQMNFCLQSCTSQRLYHLIMSIKHKRQRGVQLDLGSAVYHKFGTIVSYHKLIFLIAFYLLRFRKITINKLIRSILAYQITIRNYFTWVMHYFRMVPCKIY